MLDEELYSALIRQNANQPQHEGTLSPPALEKIDVNPLCGDKVHLYLLIENGEIKKMRHQTSGCLLCRASTEMMLSVLSGYTIETALLLCQSFLAFLKSNCEEEFDAPECLKEIFALFAPVKKYRLRKKCVSLPWQICMEVLVA